MDTGDGAGASDAGGAKNNRAKRRNAGRSAGRRVRIAALDLGTNNCRLLVATPNGRDLRIVDAFSRIVRLGEGVATTGVLSEAAMDRTLDALKVCARKMTQRGVTHQRCIATQACRSARNGVAFLERVEAETGLKFDIITTEEEAELAVAGCADLIDPNTSAALIFDIGGGSTELSWMKGNGDGVFNVAAWTSIPFGVVNLAEKYDGSALTNDAYESAVDDVRVALEAFGDPANLRELFNAGEAHFLGTSGTVTSIAGVHLKLPRYRRDKVDGMWLTTDQASVVTSRLRAMTLEGRANEPCIGLERADLVVCGCAILDALTRFWPVTRIRVADRGLREGILSDLAKKAQKERRRQRSKKTKTG